MSILLWIHQALTELRIVLHLFFSMHKFNHKRQNNNKHIKKRSNIAALSTIFFYKEEIVYRKILSSFLLILAQHYVTQSQILTLKLIPNPALTQTQTFAILNFFSMTCNSFVCSLIDTLLQFLV